MHAAQSQASEACAAALLVPPASYGRGSEVELSERPDLMLFRITYRPDLHRTDELVEADEVNVEGHGYIVLRGSVVVIGTPRSIVVRRLVAADVLAVNASLADHASQTAVEGPEVL